MKIIGFAAEGKSNFNVRQHHALIADNHTGQLSAESIPDGVDLVVAQLDSRTDEENWVELVKKSPCFISRTDA